jgi:hypothetical protein
MGVKKIYYYISKNVLFFISDGLYANLLFLINCIRLRRKFYFLNINNPRTFNEKIISLKEKNVEIKAKFANKLYLEEGLVNLGLNVKIPKIIEIFDNKSELLNYNFNCLKGKGFVIKANHGSGMNKLFSFGKLPTKKELVEISKWFAYDSSLISREKHYDLIPKKVFIEELLDFNISDFKFHVFNGKVEFIQVDLDRFLVHKRNIYDVNWNLQSFEINYSKTNILVEKPHNLQDMIKLAERISSPGIFGSYLRVDFYLNNNLIYLGEITFHPGGGVEPFDSYESDLYMGSFFK